MILTADFRGNSEHEIGCVATTTGGVDCRRSHQLIADLQYQIIARRRNAGRILSRTSFQDKTLISCPNDECLRGSGLQGELTGVKQSEYANSDVLCVAGVSRHQYTHEQPEHEKHSLLLDPA
jgi:hypothetical protein